MASALSVVVDCCSVIGAPAAIAVDSRDRFKNDRGQGELIRVNSPRTGVDFWARRYCNTRLLSIAGSGAAAGHQFESSTSIPIIAGHARNLLAVEPGGFLQASPTRQRRARSFSQLVTIATARDGGRVEAGRTIQ